MENLSLKRISADLHMGTTKLCTLSKKLSGGRTLTWLIAQRRVNAAKSLLLKSDEPVSSVAESVGFSDYNYFTKIIQPVTGITPARTEKRTEVKAAGKILSFLACRNGKEDKTV